MLSIPHLVIIFLVAFIVLGPEKLPQVARVLGKTMAEFRRITSDFRTTIEGEMREMERQTELKKEAAAMQAEVHSALNSIGSATHETSQDVSEPEPVPRAAEAEPRLPEAFTGDPEPRSPETPSSASEPHARPNGEAVAPAANESDSSEKPTNGHHQPA